MVNRDLSIHQDRLLRHAQANDLREKIDIVLCAASARGDVMVPRKRVIHAFLQ
jgi:hypothetical protein